MTGTDESTVTRVVSRDGTEIAYWTSGDGPPLVLYEEWPAPNTEVYDLPAGVEERMDALLAEGDHEAVVEALFRAAPSWQGRVAAAHTITRRCRAELGARLDP